MSQPPAPDKPIRVALLQHALPAYRVPVYRELAARQGIDLRVIYGEVPGLTNVEPDGFAAELRRPQYLGPFHVSAAWAGEADADVVFLNWNIRDLALWKGIGRAHRRGQGVILWGHGYSKHERGWAQRLRDKAGHMADAVMVYEPTTADALVARGLPREKVFHALNAIDQEPVQTARRHWLDRPDELTAFREREGLTGDVLLYVGRIEADNRVELIVDALAELPDAKAVLVGKIVGDPARSAEQARADLQARIDRLGVADRVVMPGPIYDEEKLAPYFLSSKVFVYPANVGLSLLHSFGYGVPVVTSDHIAGQNPEIVALRDGENGLLYRHGDAGDLADKLRGLLGDDARRETLAAEAYRTATEQFTLEKMVDGMVAAIRHAAGRAG